MLHIHERVLLEARANACDVAAGVYVRASVYSLLTFKCVAKIEAKYVQRQPELFALENPIFSVVTAVQVHDSLLCFALRTFSETWIGIEIK